ncbi:MAG: A/G-specific adenine glycosylase [Bdellovibrionota bacterium]
MTSTLSSLETKSPDPLHFKRDWFQRQIVEWFRKNKRDLPWRKTSDPYQIWISELMCQQTGVATVVPYFEKFIRRFPSVEALSKASEFEVLHLWQGLGYYQRARNLHKASKIIVHELGGRLPATKEELRKIPGIGEYTAGAILSIAFSISTPALDGNLIRIYSRFFGEKRPIDDPKNLKQLWARAQGLSKMKSHWVRDFTEGLMELGALVCRPKSPSCYQCPIRLKCISFMEGLTDQIPQKKKKIKRVKLQEWIHLIFENGKIGILEKGADEKYPDFHRLPFQLKDSAPKAHSFRMKYSVTHRDFEVFVLRSHPPAQMKIKWVKPNRLDQILLPAIDRKILKKEALLSD